MLAERWSRRIGFGSELYRLLSQAARLHVRPVQRRIRLIAAPSTGVLAVARSSPVS